MTDADIDARAAAILAEIRRMAQAARRSIGQRCRRGIAAVRRAADRDQCPYRIADGELVWQCLQNGTCGCGRGPK